jgi:hypothetical protein
METKLFAMVLGVALILATATVYTQSASATISQHNNCSDDCNAGTTGTGGGNGVTDGQTAHGLANACAHAPNNPHCGGQTPTGQSLEIKHI